MMVQCYCGVLALLQTLERLPKLLELLPVYEPWCSGLSYDTSGHELVQETLHSWTSKTAQEAGLGAAP